MSKKINVEAVINKKTNEVWDLWNKPEHITKWNFASDDWHCPKAENDLRVGGNLRSRMEAKDGSFGFDFGGIYDEVIYDTKISFHMSDGRSVTTIFEKSGDKTKISTTFDAENVYPEEKQRDGWQSILNNFKNYAESV